MLEYNVLLGLNKKNDVNDKNNNNEIKQILKLIEFFFNIYIFLLFCYE